MVDIMVVRVVLAEHLQWIPRETVSAVVVHCLECGDDEEQRRFPCRHECDSLGKGSTDTVKKETFQWVVVQRAICVGYIEAVMNGMEGFVQESVEVHGTMQEVFPGVNDEPVVRSVRHTRTSEIADLHPQEELQRRYRPPVYDIQYLMSMREPNAHRLVIAQHHSQDTE